MHGTLIADEDSAYVNGRSKYRVEEIETWIKVFTLDHPELTISWDQEWDDDEYGSESTVWRKGELVREESQVSGMIPMDWSKLVDEAKRVLAALEARAPRRWATAAEADSAATIIRKLIEGIDQ
jgi:hypothetical protein